MSNSKVQLGIQQGSSGDFCTRTSSDYMIDVDMDIDPPCLKVPRSQSSDLISSVQNSQPTLDSEDTSQGPPYSFNGGGGGGGECRRVVNLMCNVKDRKEDSQCETNNTPGLLMTILVRMDDKMNRQLSCVVEESDTAFDLANELVSNGFIHEDDRDKLANLIEDSLCSNRQNE